MILRFCDSILTQGEASGVRRKLGTLHAAVCLPYTEYLMLVLSLFSFKSEFLVDFLGLDDLFVYINLSLLFYSILIQDFIQLSFIHFLILL